jgi:hypothetical protein
MTQTYKFSKISSFDLEQEYLDELDKVISEAREINEINSQINSMIIEQGEKINVSAKDCDLSLNNVEESNIELEMASEYQVSSLYKKGILLTLCASVVSLPLAFAVGTKLAIGAGIGSVFVMNSII